MSALDDVLKAHRKRIAEREAAAFREMLAAYEPIEKELERAYRDLAAKIQKAKAAGEEFSPSWLYRELRLKLLLEQVREQIERFGRMAGPIVEREQAAAIRIAAEETSDVLRVIKPDIPIDIGTTLHHRLVEDAVGMMGDGSPIHDYYKTNLAPAVAEKIKSEVIRAVAIGTDTRAVARRLAEVGGITRRRALTMARTETNRVRRETKRAIYEEKGTVTAWEWVATHSPRTCVVCLAQDGKVFKLSAPFPQHTNCRCDIIPVIDGVDLPKRTLGSEWFAKQPADVQEKVLGKEAFAAYKDGKVKLDDFVGHATHKHFGVYVYRKKLAKVLPDASEKAFLWAGDPAGISAEKLAENNPIRQAANKVRALVEDLYGGNDEYVLFAERARTTDSHYITISGPDDLAAKIRIADHKPNAQKEHLLTMDLRPETKVTRKEIEQAVEDHFSRQRLDRQKQQEIVTKSAPIREQLRTTIDRAREIQELNAYKVGLTEDELRERKDEFQRLKPELKQLQAQRKELEDLLRLIR